MATNPSAVNQTQTIQPAFKRVQQAGDFDCAFACIAMIANKTLDEVIQVAIDKFSHPEHGPYWVTEELIAKIFAHYGFVSTIYKEITNGIVDLPAVAVVMVDYDPETEIGRHAVFVRDQSNQKQITAYVIDPAYWIEPSLHIRNDFKILQVSYWIGVHPMHKQPVKIGK